MTEVIEIGIEDYWKWDRGIHYKNESSGSDGDSDRKGKNKWHLHKIL